MSTAVNEKIIRNEWHDDRHSNGLQVSRIIDGSSSCEGIDVCRYEAKAGSEIALSPGEAHILSLIDGEGVLRLGTAEEELSLSSGTHVYVPPSFAACVRFAADSMAIHASAPMDRPHGEELIVHDERYLAASRFVLTPQYLSRRAFLNRDHTLISRSGDRIAWFHTTMFDTQGLPANFDGQPVFKMSYDHQSEINVIYDVGGEASVRYAAHPYVSPDAQVWSEWFSLNGQTTYYLNESADGPEIERPTDPVTGAIGCLRNRHEIYIAPGGHVSLCCLFDPGPTGLETHKPGEYSSYAPVASIVNTTKYREFLESVAETDELVRALSYERAVNGGDVASSLPAYAAFEKILDRALDAEAQLIASASEDRREIMQAWRIRRA